MATILSYFIGSGLHWELLKYASKYRHFTTLPLPLSTALRGHRRFSVGARRFLTNKIVNHDKDVGLCVEVVRGFTFFLCSFSEPLTLVRRDKLIMATGSHGGITVGALRNHFGGIHSHCVLQIVSK